MRHPVELQRYLQYAQWLRGGKDVVVKDLFPRDGVIKKKEYGRGKTNGNSCGKGTRGGRKHKPFKIFRHFQHGGNVPFYRLVRKHRLANPHLLESLPSEITLDHIQRWIEKGSLDPDRPIDMSLLVRAGLLESCEDGLKIVDSTHSTFSSKINIVVTEADQGAIKLIEKHGGTIQCRYYTTEERKQMSDPAKFVQDAIPVPRLPQHRTQLEYYTNPMNRGYLADEDSSPRGILLQLYKDAFELNKENVELPPNLSQRKIRQRGELRWDLDPRLARRDYGSRWAQKQLDNHWNHRGTDEFARRLLRADAVKPNANPPKAKGTATTAKKQKPKEEAIETAL